MLPGLRERNIPLELQSRLLPEDAAYVYMHEMESEAFRQYAYGLIEKIEQKIYLILIRLPFLLEIVLLPLAGMEK